MRRIHKVLASVRRTSDDDGFTLIELMVVVVIIAILIAIAIPTFTGARQRAQDRAAQSSLRLTVTAAKAIFTDVEDYETATLDMNPNDGAPDQLKLSEPSLVFFTAALSSTNPADVSVSSDNSPGSTKHTRFVATARSASGTCWFTQDVISTDAAAGTRWARRNAGPSGCAAQDAPAYNLLDSPGNWWRNPGEAQ